MSSTTEVCPPKEGTYKKISYDNLTTIISKPRIYYYKQKLQTDYPFKEHKHKLEGKCIKLGKYHKNRNVKTDMGDQFGGFDWQYLDKSYFETDDGTITRVREDLEVSKPEYDDNKKPIHSWERESNVDFYYYYPKKWFGGKTKHKRSKRTNRRRKTRSSKK